MTVVRPRPISWVAVLHGLGLIGAACDGTGGSSGDAVAPSPSSSPSVVGTGAPEPFDAAALDTEFPIKHVVFLIKENRTFDNLFGTFPGRTA